MNQKHLHKNQYGYVTLLTVLIISAVGTAIGISLLLISIGTSKTDLVYNQSGQAQSLANTCAEEALERLRKSVGYSGNQTLSFPQGTCVIRPVLGTGNTNRTVETIGTVGTVQRKVKIEIIQIQPKIQLSTWQEVADF